MTFLVLLLLLLCTGLVCLFSASYSEAYYKQDGNSTYFIVRQAIFAAVGLVAMFLAARLDYHKWILAAPILLIVGVGLLATIKIIPSMWVTINKATRWMWIGSRSITFQPSEITKFGVIVSFSAAAAILGPKKMKNPLIGILPFMAVIGIIFIFLKWEPHVSATAIIALTGIVIIWLGGASTPVMLILGALGGAGAGLYLLKKGGYAANRIKIWRDPFSDVRGLGWQGSQSQIAVGSGGFWGLGLGQSRQKHLYLPEPANDFIFAVMCEELGFVFTSLIVIAFGALIWRGYYIAKHAQDRFGTLLAAGITTQIAVQVILNMCVVTGLLPITGASLPFFSYGGTSLMMLLGEMGVLLSVSRSMPLSKGE